MGHCEKLLVCYYIGKKAHKRGKDGFTMGYQFDFDWGESWIVTENDFEWDRGYWCKVLARHIHFFREKVKEQKSVEMITCVQINHDSDYIGLVSVSDNYVHIILNGPSIELCWRVDEL